MLLEVNCETDFAARSDKFLDLVEDLSMQIAACECTVVTCALVACHLGICKAGIELLLTFLRLLALPAPLLCRICFVRLEHWHLTHGGSCTAVAAARAGCTWETSPLWHTVRTAPGLRRATRRSSYLASCSTRM